MLKTDYDMLIVGAGMMGLALAIGAAQQGLRVAIVEKKHLNFEELVNNKRYLALSPSTVLFLNSLGLSLEGSKCNAPIRRMCLFEAENRFDLRAEQLQLNYLALMTGAEALQAALLQRVLAEPQIVIFDESTLVRVDQKSTYPHIWITTKKYNGTTPISTGLLVGADGGNSFLRRLLAIPHIERSYAQQAITAEIRSSVAHRKTAFQRFLSTGPLAFLPLADPHTSSIVWSLDDQAATKIQALDDRAFEAVLSDALLNKLGTIKLVSARQIFPLHMRHLLRYADHRLLFIGDAAHSIHPLAGQGANLGFADVDCLLRLMKNLPATALGGRQMLNAYQRERRVKNQEMIYLMQWIKSNFARTDRFSRFCRQTGFHALQYLPMLKRLIIAYAI